MSYNVVWLDEAVDELAAILASQSTMRPILVDDANRIDELLSLDPLMTASECVADVFAAQVGRLRVTYLIDESTHGVEVNGVKLSI